MPLVLSLQVFYFESLCFKVFCFGSSSSAAGCHFLELILISTSTVTSTLTWHRSRSQSRLHLLIRSHDSIPFTTTAVCALELLKMKRRSSKLGNACIMNRSCCSSIFHGQRSEPASPAAHPSIIANQDQCRRHRHPLLSSFHEMPLRFRGLSMVSVYSLYHVHGLLESPHSSHPSSHIIRPSVCPLRCH